MITPIFQCLPHCGVGPPARMETASRIARRDSRPGPIPREWRRGKRAIWGETVLLDHLLGPVLDLAPMRTRAPSRRRFETAGRPPAISETQGPAKIPELAAGSNSPANAAPMRITGRDQARFRNFATCPARERGQTLRSAPQEDRRGVDRASPTRNGDVTHAEIT